MVFNMIALIYLAALGAVHFPSTVTGCAITAAQIDAYYGTGDGYWRIRLAWSSDNPDCTVHLHEQVDGKDKFEIVESNECEKGKYCYFKTSKQCCSNDKMRYKSMKFSTECSCHVASFTFTIQGLLSGNSTLDCEYVILPGQRPRRRKVDNMEFRECGEPCPLVKIPRDYRASGCYCKNNIVLNITTGLCSNMTCEGGPDDPKPLNLTVRSCNPPLQFVEISLHVEASRNYRYYLTSLPDNKVIEDGHFRGSSITSGSSKIGILNVRPPGLGDFTIEVVDLSPEEKYSERGNFSIHIGCKDKKELNPDVNPYCNKTGVQITEITWDVVTSRRYLYEIRVKSMVSKKVIERGKGSGSGTGDFAVSNNKAFVAFSLEPNDYVLTIKDLDVGVEDFYNESETFSVKDCPPYFPPNLTVPGCVKSTQSSIEISWNVKSGREYSYEVRGGGRKFMGNILGSIKSDDFKVEGDRGTLTITSLTEWTVALYKVTVRDLTSSVPTVETKEFKIRKGCKSPLSLDIDGKSMCLKRFSYLLISWKVEEDRTYKYSISKEGTVVKDATVPGSGSDGFPVDNGRGQLRFKLEPGDYTVTVQDLDAGVNNYYNESENFALKACNFEIETSNCVEKGQKVTVSLLAFSDRTYEFLVLVENTGQAVLNGSFLSGVSQNGVMAMYDLDSSDSLSVGRYGVLIREVETGGEGYGKFDINSYEKIGQDVKYRADPLPDGLYVCLHPREGRVLTSGLTYKINDGIESSLYGLGMCLEEAYGGGQGTLEITIKKDGKIAGRVDIDYVG